MTQARKLPQNFNENQLLAIALRYLQRFSATSHKVRQTLWRRMRPAVQAELTTQQEAEAVIEKVLVTLQAKKYLNDQNYAQYKALSLRRQGGSWQTIKQKLQGQGVAVADVDYAHRVLQQEGLADERQAAVLWAKRKKIGCFRAEEKRSEYREKDLQKLYRQGFTLTIAKYIIDADPIEAEQQLDNISST